LIPYGRDYVNPPVVSEPNWINQETQDLTRRACFDCHSNETQWLWYSNIAPASWLIYRDVIDGRRHLNFSDWNNIRLEGLGELTSVISEGEMPPLQYLLIHTSARLSVTEKGQLTSGLLSTLSR
jgi:hypothetical protein